MKKVRFESPIKMISDSMNQSDCHSPRPFIQKEMEMKEPHYLGIRNNKNLTEDIIFKFDTSDSQPYKIVPQKCNLDNVHIPNIFSKRNEFLPYKQLDLSMLDDVASNLQELPKVNKEPVLLQSKYPEVETQRYLNAIENIGIQKKDTSENSFFLKKKELENSPPFNRNDIYKGMLDFKSQKENVCASKQEIVNNGPKQFENIPNKSRNVQQQCKNSPKQYGNNQHQFENTQSKYQDISEDRQSCISCENCYSTVETNVCQLTSKRTLAQQNPYLCSCSNHIHQNIPMQCNSHMIKDQFNHGHHSMKCCHQPIIQQPEQNAIQKKISAVEQHSKNSNSTDSTIVSTQTPKEPSVSDLYKIIQLQNEQLQLLQDKVDKFIISHTEKPKPMTPIQSYTEQLTVKEYSDSDKISIGVMTSFEMIRTSTVVSKEKKKQVSKQSAQVQCNRSQISIKEVLTNQPVGINFLDGIPKSPPGNISLLNESPTQETHNYERTMNDQSLCNMQLDKVATPMASPDQSLFLDVRDYSDSDSSSDRSDVGWTYYNKVMTRVNKILHDTDMPSSASAMYRNANQQCMHVDKTNISVTKRVTFNDNFQAIRQQQMLPQPSSDTSIKMNQLAAKYLKNGNNFSIKQKMTQQVVSGTGDMSFATRNYMERHQILQGMDSPQATSPAQNPLPRFLDITELKRQPKLL